MFSRGVLFVSCLVLALAAHPTWAQDPKPKDGPLGMKFVALPKATFYMGPGAAFHGKKTEIKADFEIAIHTVTQGEWQAVMGKNPSWFSRTGGGKDTVKDLKDEDLKHFPVEKVSWDDAQEFIKKLNETEKKSGYVYRLPSEAEWVYACQGGATSEKECSYPYYVAKPTNALSSTQANFDGTYGLFGAEEGPYLRRTTKVGSYAPNKLGLYDMHGNVWQWCEDRIGLSDKAMRGGGWHDNSSFCTVMARGRGAPKDQSSDVGFRLVRVPRPVPGK